MIFTTLQLIKVVSRFRECNKFSYTININTCGCLGNLRNAFMDSVSVTLYSKKSLQRLYYVIMQNLFNLCMSILQFLYIYGSADMKLFLAQLMSCVCLWSDHEWMDDSNNVVPRHTGIYTACYWSYVVI